MVRIKFGVLICIFLVLLGIKAHPTEVPTQVPNNASSLRSLYTTGGDSFTRIFVVSGGVENAPEEDVVSIRIPTEGSLVPVSPSPEPEILISPHVTVILSPPTHPTPVNGSETRVGEESKGQPEQGSPMIIVITGRDAEKTEEGEVEQAETVKHVEEESKPADLVVSVLNKPKDGPAGSFNVGKKLEETTTTPADGNEELVQVLEVDDELLKPFHTVTREADPSALDLTISSSGGKGATVTTAGATSASKTGGQSTSGSTMTLGPEAGAAAKATAQSIAQSAIAQALGGGSKKPGDLNAMISGALANLTGKKPGRDVSQGEDGNEEEDEDGSDLNKAEEKRQEGGEEEKPDIAPVPFVPGGPPSTPEEAQPQEESEEEETEWQVVPGGAQEGPSFPSQGMQQPQGELIIPQGGGGLVIPPGAEQGIVGGPEFQPEVSGPFEGQPGNVPQVYPETGAGGYVQPEGGFQPPGGFGGQLPQIPFDGQPGNVPQGYPEAGGGYVQPQSGFGGQLPQIPFDGQPQNVPQGYPEAGGGYVQPQGGFGGQLPQLPFEGQPQNVPQVYPEAGPGYVQPEGGFLPPGGFGGQLPQLPPEAGAISYPPLPPEAANLPGFVTGPQLQPGAGTWPQLPPGAGAVNLPQLPPGVGNLPSFEGGAANLPQYTPEVPGVSFPAGVGPSVMPGQIPQQPFVPSGQPLGAPEVPFQQPSMVPGGFPQAEIQPSFGPTPFPQFPSVQPPVQGPPVQPVAPSQPPYGPTPFPQFPTVQPPVQGPPLQPVAPSQFPQISQPTPFPPGIQQPLFGVGPQVSGGGLRPTFPQQAGPVGPGGMTPLYTEEQYLEETFGALRGIPNFRLIPIKGITLSSGRRGSGSTLYIPRTYRSESFGRGRKRNVSLYRSYSVPKLYAAFVSSY